MVRVLIVGGGGREHAISDAVHRAGAELYTVMRNRNPGIMRISKDVMLTKETELEKITRWAGNHRIELAIIGPEEPMAHGLTDALEASGIPTVAPSKAAARIETSKLFMRELMKKYSIPGAVQFAVFQDVNELKHYVDDGGDWIVVKPVGLTGGKGVKVLGEHLETKADVIRYAAEVLEKKIGGEAKVLIEERVDGEEFSLQCFTDGRTVVPMPCVQDHKRAFEGDEGPNTGGMGSYSCADGMLPFITKKDFEDAFSIIQRIIEALRKEESEFRGIFYGQFMAAREGVRVIECNARFGDPEAMNVLPLLETNFIDICRAITERKLSSLNVSFERKATVCKYVVPRGYGLNPLSGVPLSLDEKGIETTGAKLYFAAVNEEQGRIFTTTSRALGIVGIHEDITKANELAEQALNFVTGEIYVRHDIGTKELIDRRIEHMRTVRSMNC